MRVWCCLVSAIKCGFTGSGRNDLPALSLIDSRPVTSRNQQLQVDCPPFWTFCLKPSELGNHQVYLLFLKPTMMSVTFDWEPVQQQPVCDDIVCYLAECLWLALEWLWREIGAAVCKCSGVSLWWLFLMNYLNLKSSLLCLYGETKKQTTKLGASTSWFGRIPCLLCQHLSCGVTPACYFKSRSKAHSAFLTGFCQIDLLQSTPTSCSSATRAVITLPSSFRAHT